MLVVYPKIDAEDCGLESGLEGTWNRYLATDLVCLHWTKEESHFTKFEKKFLKHVVKNGLHDTQVKDVESLPECEQESQSEQAAKQESELTSGKEKSLKEGDKAEEKKPVKRGEKVAKKEEKSLKREDKTIKKEDNKLLVKKELRTTKSDSVLRREPRVPKTDQNSMSMKRNSKIFKADPKAVKTETSPRSSTLKRDQKVTKPYGDDRRLSMRLDAKTAKNGHKVAKKEEKPVTPEPEMTELAETKENKLEAYKVKMQETYATITNAYNTYRTTESPLLTEIFTHPVFRGACLTMVLFAFYFLSTEILVTLLLLAASIWFKYGSKEPEFQKYTRSSDPRVLAFRGMYEREIEKLRHAREPRVRGVHEELKESVLNAYAVTRVAKGDRIGVKEHEELERELELTFKEFVTANDVKSLLHEAHHTSFVLAFTVFLYLASRVVYLALARIWRPVRTAAIILAGILLCFALCIVSNFLLTSFISRRLVGSAEMLSVVFGLWFVTDVTGFLIEIRACIDHVTGVIWRECELERCIMKTPSYLVVKLALDCAVLLSLFPLAYLVSGVLSYFSVSSYTIVSVSRFFPPVGLFLRLCTRLAFLGEILRVANVIMFASLASKFYGLHNKKEDPLDSFLYRRFGYDMGCLTEYLWKGIVKYINDLN